MKKLKNQNPKPLNPKTRFDLEEQITRAWQVTEDLDLFLRRYIDSPKVMTEDEVWNVVYGISKMHDLRMQEMWDTYEFLVKEGAM